MNMGVAAPVDAVKTKAYRVDASVGNAAKAIVEQAGKRGGVILSNTMLAAETRLSIAFYGARVRVTEDWIIKPQSQSVSLALCKQTTTRR